MMSPDTAASSRKRSRRSALAAGVGFVFTTGCIAGEFESNGSGTGSPGDDGTPDGDGTPSGGTDDSGGSTRQPPSGTPASATASVSSPTEEIHPNHDLPLDRMTVTDHDLTGSSQTYIDVAVPDDYDESGSAYRVLYLLPVEPGVGDKFGNALESAQRVAFGGQRVGIHNHANWVLARPTFNVPPWYGNHAAGKTNQRAHLTDVVVPAVESLYNVKSAPDGRLLMGYSKSGFGVYSLIAHRPDVFGYAASWDAPLDMDPWFPNWGIEQTFGTEQAFVNQHPRTVLKSSPDPFQNQKRLVLDGHDKFGSWPEDHRDSSKTEHTEATHQYLNEVNIKHEYKNGIDSGHTWNSGGGGWMNVATKQLQDLTGNLG